jgi:hypothetical protein
MDMGINNFQLSLSKRLKADEGSLHLSPKPSEDPPLDRFPGRNDPWSQTLPGERILVGWQGWIIAEFQA